MFRLCSTLRHKSKSRRGATAIEYALLCAFIGVVIATTLALTGTELETAYTRIVNMF